MNGVSLFEKGVDNPLCKRNVYGTWNIENDRIVGLNEEKLTGKGFIHAGVYAITKYVFEKIHTQQYKFSFERIY
jgi:hypothetical protein